MIKSSKDYSQETGIDESDYMAKLAYMVKDHRQYLEKSSEEPLPPSEYAEEGDAWTTNTEGDPLKRTLLGGGLGAAAGGLGTYILQNYLDSDEEEGEDSSSTLRRSLLGALLGGVTGGGAGYLSSQKNLVPSKEDTYVIGEDGEVHNAKEMEDDPTSYDVDDPRVSGSATDVLRSDLLGMTGTDAVSGSTGLAGGLLGLGRAKQRGYSPNSLKGAGKWALRGYLGGNILGDTGSIIENTSRGGLGALAEGAYNTIPLPDYNTEVPLPEDK